MSTEDLLAEYGIDEETFEGIPEAGYATYEDGWYPFEVGDVYKREGTDNKPDTVWINIEYLIGEEGGKYTEWFTLPEDPTDPGSWTKAEIQKMGFLKSRLKDLGVSRANRDEMVGLTGTLKLKTTTGKDKKEYQNIVEVKLDDGSAAEAPAEKPAPKVAEKPERKAPTAKAAGTAKPNPFAKR